MAVVETDCRGQVLVVRMNRPERLNVLNHEMQSELAEIWTDFRHSSELEVAILTGTGRGICAGADMNESLRSGTPGGKPPAKEDPFIAGTLEKPVIAAVNGFAMGGGFMLVERTACGSQSPKQCSRCRKPSAGAWAATTTATSPTCRTRSPWRWRLASASLHSASTRSDS